MDRIKFDSKEHTPKSSEFSIMTTENLFRQVFGKRYYGTASIFTSEKYFKKHISKLISHLISDVSGLVAPEELIDYLNYQLGYFNKEISDSREMSPDSRAYIVIGLKIIATLLGYHYSTGDKKNEPYFVPSLWAEMQGWNNLTEFLNTEEYLNSQERAKIVKQLILKGFSATRISLILNLTGYKTAQLIKRIKKDDKK